MLSRIVIAAAAVAALAARADAYPQYQMSREQTCTACHTSPAGGGLLNENGTAFAETMSQFGTPPEFMYAAFKLPSWLLLGGDLRGFAGFDRTPQDVLVAFPMQTDVYAEAKYKGISLHVTGGYRPAEHGNEAATHLWSREHYLMWKQNADGTDGLFVRVGRFMPVFGLRFAEHPDYTRRYGGTELYSETYGLAIEYIDPKWEAHATGFIKDPLIDPVEHYNGAAVYGEYRITDSASAGLEGMVKTDTFDRYWRGGATGKYYIKGPDVLLQLEAQYVHHWIDNNGFASEAVGYLMGSWFIANGFLFDLGLGYYNENTRIKGVDRECVDGNFHWFATSHVEGILNLRYETIQFGSGALSGAWALLQLHYRL